MTAHDNGPIDRHPALIARARRTTDVVAAVRFAAERGLSVSIRGGGHSAAGHAAADDALMLDLSGMKAARVDPGARTAIAEPGLLWRELDAATQAHGLATTGGVVGSTGVAGLTLGGGIGYLDRLAGLTCDNLLAAEVVTAAGQILQADAQQNADLFWALRGGGGAPEGQCGVVAPFPVPALGPMATGAAAQHPAPRLRTISYWYGDACRVKSSAYVPLRASSSECVPDSTTDPSRNT